MGLFGGKSEEEKITKVEAKAERMEAKAEAKAAKLEAKAARRAAIEQARLDEASVLITTADIREDYEIIDCIFAIDASKSGFFSGINPNQAFDGVKKQLRKRCYELGGQAVINCQFEYRNATDGKRSVLEIFAYGTAVRI